MQYAACLKNAKDRSKSLYDVILSGYGDGYGNGISVGNGCGGGAESAASMKLGIILKVKIPFSSKGVIAIDCSGGGFGLGNGIGIGASSQFPNRDKHICCNPIYTTEVIMDKIHE